MNLEAFTFFAFTLLAVVIQAIFCLFEMACVSFSKVRLQYYVALKKRRALWLNYLISRPSRLFGAALVGVNTALQVGSECSRRFYESIHLDPDWAPLSQFFIVIVFAELAPLFAARRHPEQIAMFLSPIMILLMRLLTPVILAFDALSRIVHRVMGKSEKIPLFLSREEVKMAFQEKEDEFTILMGNIFQLKSLTAKELMTPSTKIHAVSSTATVADVRSLLSVHYSPFIPIYHRVLSNIVAITSLRNLFHLEDSRCALENARSPWFVTQDTSVLQILNQFRKNNQSVAVILDSQGHASGLLSLDQILMQILGGEAAKVESEEEPSFHVHRTLSGEMLVSQFNREFHTEFPCMEGETLSEFLTRHLEHPPVKGEVIRMDPFVFTVLEPSLLGAKILSVETLGGS